MTDVGIALFNDNQINQRIVDEVAATIDNINHLESILIQKIKYRRGELERMRKDYELAIQAYSNILTKLV